MFESIDPIITFELIRIHTQFYPYKINILTKFSLKIRRNHFYFSTKNWRHDLFWEMDTTKNTPSSPSKPCLYSPLYSLWPAVDNQVTTFEDGEPIVRAFSRPWRVNRFVAQSILIDAARFWTIRIPKNTSRALSWPSLTSLVVFFSRGPHIHTHRPSNFVSLPLFTPLAHLNDRNLDLGQTIWKACCRRANRKGCFALWKRVVLILCPWSMIGQVFSFFFFLLSAIMNSRYRDDFNYS